jgi:hypothetical protein
MKARDMAMITKLWDDAMAFVLADEPRPGLHPIPGTKPINIEALILPPVMYYIALLFLPPPPPQAVDTITIKLLRTALAVAAAILFFRLPLVYYIPQSIGLNYQLSLVGLYGCCRVLDAFFISPILFSHIPRRVRYEHQPRVETPGSPDTQKKRMGYADSTSTPSSWDGLPSQPLDSYFPFIPGPANVAEATMEVLSKTISGPERKAVYQFETSEDGWPHTFLDRASWALELELYVFAQQSCPGAASLNANRL